jgi:hypothetical protein
VKKFLMVGCGGSGGATLRYLMDQLRADLRVHDIHSLPPAWQFLHIDVPPSPEETKGLGSVRDLGGRYLSVSSPGNSYQLVANNLEQRLGPKGALRELLGWAPTKERVSVDVTKGAGQYRGVGRALTLTDLGDIMAELGRTWEQVQRPDAWGELPAKHPEGGPYETTADVIPVVVGSMAGGSGASMFLDVCRILGRLPGLNRTGMGVFLFTADVFSSLTEAQRTGVDGNALGALGEVIAAQTRSSDAADAQIFEALGIPPEPIDQPAFARLFPIGSSIGGDGAKFGDGTHEGVYRGLGRALAATVSSSKATAQYSKKLENPNQKPPKRESLGWGTDPDTSSWLSLGFASLSLGRDRYADYAGQRLARNAFDRLIAGHYKADNQLPSDEQLNELLNAQFSSILQRLAFPDVNENAKTWFLSRALPDPLLTAECRVAVGEAVAFLGGIAPAQAQAWINVAAVNLPGLQESARRHIADAAYRWANGWATQLETAAREEYLRAMTQLGVPYANAVVKRLREHLGPLIDRLRSAPPTGDPLIINPEVGARAAALKKTMISAAHAVGEEVSRGYLESAKGAMEREAARLGGEVLAAYASEVLAGLERAGITALQNLHAAREATRSEAGLAQLATTIYAEWPLESGVVPTRFDHADNEVLLTTSAEFPGHFRDDVTRSVTAAGGYEGALSSMVSEIISGRWQTTGGVQGDYEVVVPHAPWRAMCLPTHPTTKDPTPRSQPTYALTVSTADLLGRAHAHLSRPDQPFEQFSQQTIDEYLTDATVSDAERERRAADFVEKFRATLMLARPLVGVSAPMVQVMHAEGMRYEYSFSDVPLNPTIAARVSAVLEADQTLDSATLGNFNESLHDPQLGTRKVNKIALFGSHPPYSPLVFSSLLDQVQKRWASTPEQGLPDLWRWKRTRPLPASLAMGSDELNAMIRGWFLGRLLGLVVVPRADQPSTPAQVWDVRRNDWAAFPQRLLSPPSTFKSPHDWLPALLESHSLALVQCNGDVSLGALQSYVALRAISDDTPDQPYGAFGETSGVRLLTSWLQTGAWPSGRASEVPQLAGSESMTPQERATAAKEWLTEITRFVGTTFLTEGAGVGSLARRRARIDTVAELERAPMFAEVAELVLAALEAITVQVDDALGKVQQSMGGSGSGPFI